MERIYGLLGRKLGHSWSAPIHHELGCGSYRLIELEPEMLEGFLRREDIGGLNVTIPYKRAVMACCDEIDPLAKRIGSVNTIVRREGKLLGFNTDAAGFLYMARAAGISFAGKKVVVLGSGGASLTVQATAASEGAREVVVISRSGENNYENLHLHADADIVVNATPVGMFPRCGVPGGSESVPPVPRRAGSHLQSPAHRPASPGGSPGHPLQRRPSHAGGPGGGSGGTFL